MTDDDLPQLNLLHFAILSILRVGERSGRQMRAHLANDGIDLTGPAFYGNMARMEDDGLVDGWYATVEIGDQEVNERRYRITDEGRDAWDDRWSDMARSYYRQEMDHPSGG